MAKSVEIDPEKLRQHYASLSDDALLDLNRSDLTDLGRQYYDVEMASRRLRADSPSPEPVETRPVFDSEPGEASGTEYDACVFAQTIRPGVDAGGDTATVMNALSNARIPCKMIQEHVEPKPSAPYDEYRVMVPIRFAPEASSILDRDIIYADLESKWQAHFAELTDAELIDVDPENLFAGLVDRIERTKRAYDEELRRRGLARRVSRA